MSSLLNYVSYFACALGMLILGIAIYVYMTPVDELGEIRRENRAAAWALGGFMVGYASVIYSVTAHGGHWWEIIVWSAVAVVLQIAVCELFYYPLGFKRDMQSGSDAAGIALGMFSLAVGLVNAGCLT